VKGHDETEYWKKRVESVTGVEEIWFMQVLMLRLAASKAPPGDSAGRGCFAGFWK